MTTLTITLTVLAVITILVLTAVAAIMWRRVFRQREQVRQQTAVQLERRRKQREELIESITVIARTLVAGEMNESEAAIRLKVLLDNLYLSEEERQRFANIEEMYEMVKDFDTHQMRQQLPKNERMKQDLARNKIEVQYRDKLLKDARALLEYQFPALH
ncbi:DUF2489 domain-containing protein [Gynuella sunshinyii]|uniref:DUF2489 domain-containing protein n=1 Tax=Gynuella sunshinyii YC6258 TaxID=1445510 RepID=A0A0C5VQ46_9GAMM|nr:DUF2489 domain-containing protein [Gynuella sunshinyii]AJQ96712.1 hypothetical Protein YC6258_04680 [Gynuella sunshinyii YC6258]